MFSAEELELMQGYINTYSHKDSMPIEEWLRNWYMAKENFLLPLFNNKLILRKPFKYQKPRRLIIENIMCKLFNDATGRYLQEDVAFMLQLIKNLQTEEEVSDSLRLDRKTFFNANNYIEGKMQEAITFYVKGVKFHIARGAKPIRALRIFFETFYKHWDEWKDYFSGYAVKRIDDIYHYYSTSLTDFATIYSQIINNKFVSGILCLSIHPMDYMTMSDNGYNWTSCMRWMSDSPLDAGEYHSGTVGCMNSYSTVVAYLEGDETWYPLGEDYIPWSNKKWRELFVIDSNFIAGIKGYPYKSSEMEQNILMYLANLVTAHTGRGFNFQIKRNQSEIRFNNGSYWEMDAGPVMYNDAEYNDISYITAASYSPEYDQTFCYADEAYCTVCGCELSYEEKQFTCCEEHYNFKICDDCGDRIPEDAELITIQLANGEEIHICERCYEYNTHTCAECGEEHIFVENTHLNYGYAVILDEAFINSPLSQSFMHFIGPFPRADKKYRVLSSALYLCPHCQEKMLKEKAIFMTRFGWNEMIFETNPDYATGFFLNPDYARKYLKLSVKGLKTYEEVKQMM